MPATAGGRASVSETLAIAGSSIEAPILGQQTSSRYLSFAAISTNYADGTRGKVWTPGMAITLLGVISYALSRAERQRVGPRVA